MGIQLSSGVSLAEIDLSTVVVGTGTTGGVIAGPFTWGPASVKTLVDSEVTLVNTFGKPSNDTADVFFSAASFLQYGNNLSVVRVLSTAARNAAVINDGVSLVAITNPGAGYGTAPVLTFSAGAATATCTIDANGSINSVTVTNHGASYVVATPPTFGTSLSAPSHTTLAVLTPVIGIQIKNETDYNTNYSTGTAGAGEFCAKFAGSLGDGLQIDVCDDSAQFASWPYKGYFTGAPGTSDYANGVNGSHDELHMVVFDSLGTITGIVGSVLETYAFVSKASDAKDAQGASIYYPTVLDRKSKWIRFLGFPSAGTYWGNIARNTTFGTLTPSAVRATKTLLTLTAGIVYTAGTAGEEGNDITVEYKDPAADNATLDVELTSDGEALNVITVNLATSGLGAITSTATLVKAAVDAAVTAQHAGLVTTALVGNGAGVVTAFAPTALVGGADNTSYTVMLNGGADANVSGSTAGTVTDGIIEAGYDLFNTSDFNFGLILTASHSATVCQYLYQNIAEERMDCVAFISPPKVAVVNNAGSESAAIVAYRNTLASSTYAFMDGNWIKKYDKYNDLYRWLPANGDVAGLCVRTDQVRDPWFSPAGLNRGQIKGAVDLAWNPSQTYRDALYMAGVNPIVAFPGQGPVLFGDKMLTVKPSAFDRINVRRLFIVIEQAISAAARFTLYEFNDDVTRVQFRSLIDPFLRDVQGRRGLYAYKIVCDSTNNTAQMIDTNQFQCDIYLQPAKSINFIKLNFVATRNGISISEIVGQF